MPPAAATPKQTSSSSLRAFSALCGRMAHDLSGSTGALRMFLELQRRKAGDGEDSMSGRLIAECQKLSEEIDLLMQVQDFTQQLVRAGQGGAASDVKNTLHHLVHFLKRSAKEMESPPAEWQAMAKSERELGIQLLGLECANQPANDLSTLREQWVREKTPDRIRLLKTLLAAETTLGLAGWHLETVVQSSRTLELKAQSSA